MTKRILLLCALVAASISVAAIGSATPVSAAAVYGPSYGRFSINFPAAPTAFNDTHAVRSVLTGYSSVYAYTVASPSKPFAERTTPKPPAFWVVVAKPGPGISLNQFLNLGRTLNAAKRVSLGGWTAYVSIFPETSKYLQNSVITDKSATEGLLFTHQGSTLYLAEAVAAQALTVHAFLFSFRPAG
jgi:hypothetical protein